MDINGQKQTETDRDRQKQTVQSSLAKFSQVYLSLEKFGPFQPDPESVKILGVQGKLAMQDKTQTKVETDVRTNGRTDG